MKSQSDYGPWMRASTEFWLLGIEAWSVMALRMMKIAGGGPRGEAEFGRMFTEKMTAAAELQARLTGGMSLTPLDGARTTIRHYRRKVAANSKRLRGSGR